MLRNEGTVKPSTSPGCTGDGISHRSVYGQKSSALVTTHLVAPRSPWSASPAPSNARPTIASRGQCKSGQPRRDRLARVVICIVSKEEGSSSLPQFIVQAANLTKCLQIRANKPLRTRITASTPLAFAGRHDSSTSIVDIGTAVNDRRRSHPRNGSRNAIAAQAVGIEYHQVLTVEENVRVPAEPRSTGCFGACRQ